MIKEISLDIMEKMEKPYEFQVLSHKVDGDCFKVFLNVTRELAKGKNAHTEGKMSEHLDDYLCSPFRHEFSRMMREGTFPKELSFPEVDSKYTYSNHSSIGYETLVITFFPKE